MKVWIVAKIRHQEAACIHGLTEEKQNIRLLQPNGTYPSSRTKFEVGQIWDLVFTPLSRRIPLHLEDVIVKGWKYLGDESNLQAMLLEKVDTWRGGPLQLFEGYLKGGDEDIRWKTNTPFISERDTLPSPVSIGYWLPDVPLIKWHDAEDRLCYRYYNPAGRYFERELLIDYRGFTHPIFKIPAQALVHVALHSWWVPSNDWYKDEESKVKRRAYLYLAGWYI
jgi:hypothetical protein